MSTYTDLHNKLKETINIDYTTRATNQEVKMLNPDNVYRGQFEGSMTIDENSQIHGAHLYDVTLSNATLCGDIKWGGTDIPVTEIVTKINDLSTDLYGEGGSIPTIRNDIGNLNSRIDAIAQSCDIGKVSSDLIAKIDANTTLIKTTSSEITGLIDANTTLIKTTSSEITGMVNGISTQFASDIDYISGRVDVLCSEISNAIVLSTQALCAEIDTTNKKLKDESDERKRINKIIKNKLNEHETEFDNVKHKIEHDRHYEIYNVPTFAYPYQLNDYSINRFNIKISNGSIIYNGIQIAETYTNADGQLTAFMTMNINKFPNLGDALVNGRTYELKGEYTEAENRFVIWYKDNNFVLQRPGQTFLKVDVSLENSSTSDATTIREIGRIINFKPEADVGTVVLPVDSGNLRVYQTTDPILSTFSTSGKAFSKEEPIITYAENSNKVIYNWNSEEFTFKFNCTSGKACELLSEKDSSYMGAILSDDVVGPIDNIEKFKVSLAGFAESKVTLLSSNSYFTESLEGKRVKYDPSSKTLNVKDKIIYEYITRNNNEKIADIKIRPAKHNTHLSSYDYNVLVADIVGGTIEKTHSLRLSADLLRTIWSIETVIDGQEISVLFDSQQQILSKTLLDDHGHPFTRDYKLVADSERIESAEVNVTSKPISFVFDKEIDISEKVYHCAFGNKVQGDSPTVINGFTVELTGNKPIKIYVPKIDKSGDMSAVSREFFLTTKAIGNCKSIEYKFFDPNGIDDGKSDITIYHDKLSTLFVPTNAWYTYMFNEVNPNCFLVTDLNHHDISSDITDLSNALENEIKARIAADESISAQVSANTKDIKDIYSKIVGGLTYEGELSLTIEQKFNDWPLSTFAGLVAHNLWYRDGSPETDLEPYLSVNLLNGNYFIAISPNKSKKYIIDGRQVCNGDLIVVKENTTVRNLTANKINIIDIMDSDAVHEDRLCEVSSALSADYHKQISDLSVDVYSNMAKADRFLSTKIRVNQENIKKLYNLELAISAELSNTISTQLIELEKSCNKYTDNEIKNISVFFNNEITSARTDLSAYARETSSAAFDAAREHTINKIKKLSTSLSNTIDAKFEDTISTINAISIDIYKNADSQILPERGLSGKVDFLLSSDRKSMCYGGTMKSIDFEPSRIRWTYMLSDFLFDNGISGFLKTGFMFRLSAVQKFYPTPFASAYIFNENDYFIVNKDVFASSITSNDINVIYDASDEGKYIEQMLKDVSVILDTRITDVAKTANTAIRRIDDLQISVKTNYDSLNKKISDLDTKAEQTYVKISADNVLKGHNTFINTTVFNDIVAEKTNIAQAYVNSLSVSFDKVIDISSSNSYLSDNIEQLDVGILVIELVNRANEIITVADIPGIPLIQWTTAVVNDILTTSNKIYTYAYRSQISINTLNDARLSLNAVLGKLTYKASGQTLASRLKAIELNMKNLAEYATQINYDLCALSVYVNLSIADISASLSSIKEDLTDLSVNHYVNTFCEEDKLCCSTIKSDNLVITDINAHDHDIHDRYYMTFKYGSLTLKKMA